MSEITNPLNGEVLPCTRETLAAELQTQRVSASGDDEELKEALNRFALALEAYQRWEPEVGGARYPTAEYTELTDSHAAIESLFGRIREERDRALHEIDDCVDRYCGVCVSCRSLAVFMGVCRACTFKQNDAPKLIESLRSSSLTPIQAEVCLIGLRQFTEMPDDDPLLEKLRLISGGALKEGATQ